MKGITKDNCEEYFFEFFEGGLSKEEKSMVLEFVEKDPLYRQEFEYWEKSYVREPLPDKLKLEDKLLKRDSSLPYFLFGGIFFITLIFVIYFNSTTNEKINHIVLENKSLPKKQTEKVVTNEDKLFNNPKRLDRKKVAVVLTSKEINSKDFGVDSLSVNEDIKVPVGVSQIQNHINNSAIDSTLDSSNINFVEKNIITTTKETNKADKKEQRAKQRELEKYKQKSIEKKQADRYLKGNVPYVVPINPNNF
jgi:hypothetical protein